MTFDWTVVWQHRDALLTGTVTTIFLTIATMAIAVPCGIVIAILRLYAPTPIRALATAYVELFRNLPLILVVFWAFYVLPILTGLGLSPLATGLAYSAMQVRAQTFRVLEMLTAMAAIYWLLGYPQAKLVDWIQRRYAVTE